MSGLGLLLLSLTPQNNDTNAIIQAFKSGNAENVAAYFDEFVDMKLLDKPEVKNMSRNQAGIALKSFFSDNGIKGFDKQSDRELGNTMYLTGKLTGNNKNFSITVMLKQKEGKYQVITIRIN